MDRLRNNLGLKILALLLSILSFVYVKGTSQSFSELPALRLYTARLVVHNPENTELVPYVPDTLVTVTLKGTKSMLDRIEPAAVLPVLDLSRCTKPGNALVAVTVPSLTGAEISEISPSHVLASISKLQAVSVPVEVKVKGAPAEGYKLGTVLVNPSNVVVLGAQEKVEEVCQVEVPVSVNGAKLSFSSKAQNVRFVDDKGFEVSDVSLKNNEEIDITVPLYREANVAVDAGNVSVRSRQGWTYAFNVEPAFVHLIGDGGVTVPDYVSTVPYIFDHADKLQKKKLNIIVPQGFVVADIADMQVSVTMVPSKTGSQAKAAKGTAKNKKNAK